MKPVRTIDWNTAASALAVYLVGIQPDGSRGLARWPCAGFYAAWHDGVDGGAGIIEQEVNRTRSSMEGAGGKLLEAGMVSTPEGRKTFVGLYYLPFEPDVKEAHNSVWVDGMNVINAAVEESGIGPVSLNPNNIDKSFEVGLALTATGSCSLN